MRPVRCLLLQGNLGSPAAEAVPRPFFFPEVARAAPLAVARVLLPRSPGDIALGDITGRRYRRHGRQHREAARLARVGH